MLRTLRNNWWLFALRGFFALLFGVTALALVRMGLTMTRLVNLMALWALGIGVCELAEGWRLKKHVADEWMLAAGGALSLAFGF